MHELVHVSELNTWSKYVMVMLLYDLDDAVLSPFYSLDSAIASELCYFYDIFASWKLLRFMC